MTRRRNYDDEVDYPASDVYDGRRRDPRRRYRPPMPEDPDRRAAEEWLVYGNQYGVAAVARLRDDQEKACYCAAKLADFLRINQVRARHWCPKHPAPNSAVPRVYMPDVSETDVANFLGVNHVNGRCMVYTAPEHDGFLDRTTLAPTVREGLFKARKNLSAYLKRRNTPKF